MVKGREKISAGPRQNQRKRKELLFYCALMAFPILQFCVFYIGVNVNSFVLAFTDYEPLTGRTYFAGFDVFQRVFYDLANDSIFLTSLVNSLIAYFATTLLGMSLALVFSYYIFRKQFASKFFKIMLFLPSIISSIVMITVFKHFVESAIPDFIYQLTGKRVLGLLTDTNTAFGTILFYNLWIAFGTSILMYVGAMGGINESVLEAAKIDGANALQEFFRVVLPLIYPTITVFLTVGIAGIFTNQLGLFSFFGLTADSYLYTFGYYMYKNVQGASQGTLSYLAALGLLMTLVAAPLTLAVRALLLRFGPSSER